MTTHVQATALRSALVLLIVAMTNMAQLTTPLAAEHVELDGLNVHIECPSCSPYPDGMSTSSISELFTVALASTSDLTNVERPLKSLIVHSERPHLSCSTESMSNSNSVTETKSAPTSVVLAAQPQLRLGNGQDEMSIVHSECPQYGCSNSNMSRYNIATETEPTPAVAVGSKQQPLTQTTKAHSVRTVFSPCGEQAVNETAVAASATPLI